jgi:uncharacterized membrane protein YqjE
MSTAFSEVSSRKGNRPSLTTRVTDLVRDVGNLARDHLELATLEARRAAIGLTKVVSAAVVISILVVTAWLSFVASAIVWATDAGVSWPIALAVAGVLNIALAVGVVFWVRSLKDDFMFSATLRQVRETAEEAKAEVT